MSRVRRAKATGEGKAVQKVQRGTPAKGKGKSRKKATVQKTKLPRDHWEIFVIKAIVKEGIPAPEREYRFHTERRWRFDMAWPGLSLAVEVEGGLYRGGRHVTPVGYEKDCEKYNTALLNGWSVIRVTPTHIKKGLAIRWILDAYALKKKEREEIDRYEKLCDGASGDLDRDNSS